MTELIWFVRDKDRVRGPFSQEQLVKQYKRGVLARFHDISTDRKSWVKAATLLDPISAPPGPVAAEPSSTWSTESREATAPVSGEHSWPQVTDDFNLVGLKGAKKSNKSRWAIAVSILCSLGACFLTFLVIRNARQVLPKALVGPATIQSLDQDQVDPAIGLVVVGIEQKKPDGTHGDILISTGTCFSITEDGYLVTNRHVVELYEQMKEAADDEQRKRIYTRLMLERNRDFNEEMDKVAADEREGAKERRYQKIAAALNYNHFAPKIWVFFPKKNARPEKYIAEIEHLCDKTQPDIAILKIKPKGTTGGLPFFRLSGNADAVKQGDPVVAIGFPGATRTAVSDGEKVEERLRMLQGTRVEALFKERDFKTVRTDHKVTQIFVEAGGCKWIQHDAVITHGNSGGPLLNSQGVVLGVNTWGDSDGATYRAISLAQLKDIILDNARGAVFDPN